ncbi:MAG TPA: flagellar hook capping FlgD N-terminal domain-containing protein [Verrucomicrobiae bacterium]|nr:flagellar hook capping FlgD N-terminal domain-containing protein [Verrucomicrobiae bacterium]
MSSVSAIATSNVNPDSDTQDRIPKQTLGQDDFLKLLVAQLSAQDPLNPVSNTDFVAQMASFSTLSQAQSTGADIAALRSEQQVSQANSLLGRTVTLQSADGTLTGGVVSGVVMVDGVPNIVVNGGNYDLSQLFAIAPTPVSQP